MDIALEQKLKETKGKAQSRFEEICRLILDGDNNLALLLVKSYRAGLPAEKAEAAFAAIEATVAEARAIYTAAIAQPEPRIKAPQRVVL